MPHETGGPWLLEFLRSLQLDQFYVPIRDQLNVTRAEHFDFVQPSDLDGIGMGKPAQRRLAEAVKRQRPGLKPKNWVYKILGARGSEPKEGEGSSPESVLSPPSSEPDGALKCLIPEQDVRLGEQLGAGCFGVVHRAIWTLPGGKTVPVAVKSLRSGATVAAGGAGGPALGDFLQEVTVMLGLDHPHLLRLYGVVLGTQLHMVMELAPLGSLESCLLAPSPMPLPLLCLFLRQLVDAMSYLEGRGLVHRDLATRNLLLAAPDVLKVADFGLVRHLGGPGGRYIMGGPRPIPYAWCAPESLRLGAFSSASDVWMFGVTLWEMFSGGREPWAGLSAHQILQRLERDRLRLERPQLCPRGLYGLARRCWASVPADRPTFRQLDGLLREAWPPEVRCVREPNEPGALRMEPGDLITVIDGSPDLPIWRGQNGRTLKSGPFPAAAVSPVQAGAPGPGPAAPRISLPIRGTFQHTAHGDHRLLERSWASHERMEDRGRARLREAAVGRAGGMPLHQMKGLSKSLESVLSSDPVPTRARRSPPDARRMSAVPLGGLASPPRGLAAFLSQAPRERVRPKQDPGPSDRPPDPWAPPGGSRAPAAIPNAGARPDLELLRKIKEVETSVHGVTRQECQEALRATGGAVPAAIQNLKVEQLFHLSNHSRNYCRRVLERNQWDLSAASRYILAHP
ncbi:non-receptor tyrosine-protein kinase TNK1 [Ornithorhynchus anatinus]|uniref:non-specific protein-tyrosine kinase n=1 Tax=Ornithorhynchus anatinus TaxID=9258 RepID=A0A6I8NTJ2_ORNAN|nr:non-receptor tyrosine-protein kinase TNK1 [Ornithorhynchus anatinus]